MKMKKKKQLVKIFQKKNQFDYYINQQNLNYYDLKYHKIEREKMTSFT